MPGFESPWPTTCPRCGRESGLELLHEASGGRVGPRAGYTRGYAFERAGLYQCPTCHGFTLRTILTEGPDGTGRREQIERLPLGTAKSMAGLPPAVEADRDEAWRAFHGGLFKGAALLGRSSLEAAVKDRGATGRDLEKKIENLAAQGAITQDLAAWAHEVRITGNEAAHEMGPVSEDDARNGLFFLDAFLDAIYAVPHRHRELQARRAAKGTGAAPEGSAPTSRKIPFVE